MTRRQLFLSHTWIPDEQGRDTHVRARRLKNALSTLGWTVWFDEDDMKGNIEASMSDGIEQADAVVMLLTRRYARKINHGARLMTSNDNCLKEFNYSFFMKKKIIPVIFEDAMILPEVWSPGIFPMRLSMEMYINGTEDNLEQTACEIGRLLSMFGIRPLFLPRTVVCAKRPSPLYASRSAPSRIHTSSFESRRWSSQQRAPRPRHVVSSVRRSHNPHIVFL